MSKCSAFEPAPTRFYAPAGLFFQAELTELGVEWLGSIIISPGKSFRYQVASGPLCRLYWNNGVPEPHSFESAYQQDERGRWQRTHGNYLSYQLVDSGFVTVRWQPPMIATRIALTKNQKHSAA